MESSIDARLAGMKDDDKGIKIDNETMAILNIERDNALPKWNDTIRPQTRNFGNNMTAINQTC